MPCEALLRASEVALEDAAASPAHIEALYRRRAVRLAEMEAHPKPAIAGVPALTFRLAQERYAIELKEVAEIVSFAGCTPVPGPQTKFLGVINLRGDLRAVLDLGSLLALSESGDQHSGFVLILRRQGWEIGLKIDHIEDLI